MSEPKRPTCFTCPYWGETYGDGEGECRRLPPSLVQTEIGAAKVNYANSGVFPVTVETDWCGEHPDFPAYLAQTRATLLGQASALPASS